MVSAPFGSYSGRTECGEVFVIFGRNVSAGASFPNNLLASQLNGANGFRFLKI